MSRRPLEACIQSPTDVHPFIPELSSSGSLGKNRTTHQSDRRRGRGTGGEERFEGLLTVCGPEFVEHLLGDPPLCVQVQTQTSPICIHAIQSLPSQKGLCFHTDTIGKPSRINGQPESLGGEREPSGQLSIALLQSRCSRGVSPGCSMVCKMGIIIPTSSCCCKSQGNKCLESIWYNS